MKNDYATDLTDANPGAGYQNPNAFWVVIDPKTGGSFIVENNLKLDSPDESQPRPFHEALEISQEFVKDDLMGN